MVWRPLQSLVDFRKPPGLFLELLAVSLAQLRPTTVLLQRALRTGKEARELKRPLLGPARS